jgi:hypothetical protein
MIWLRLLAAAALAAAIAWAIHTYNESLREDGRAEVRTQWQAATDKAKAEEEARAKQNQATAKAAELRFAKGQNERFQVVEVIKKEVIHEAVSDCRVPAGLVGVLNDAANRLAPADRGPADAAGAGLPTASPPAQ